MITILKSKIHRATVIETDLECEGSCVIDEQLMYDAHIQPYEQLHIFNVTTGQRLITYAIPSHEEGMVSLNGSAARYGVPGDKIILCAYHHVSESLCERAAGYKPTIIKVDDKNSIVV